MTIYDELVRRVDDGESFHIDFVKQRLKVGDDLLIACGEPCDKERKLIDINTKDILREIEELYKNYKYSLPSERSDGKRRKYFKALSIDEIPDEKLLIAERREVACAKLEGFILCAVLNGDFTWTDEMGSWFWQSKNDPELVILKQWI